MRRSARSEAASTKPTRLVWLDITRVLCAVMILGIHWLRASFKVHLFGDHQPVSLVINYQDHNLGFGMFNYVLVGGTGHSLAVWLTNLIGVFGGFGWEGVSALIIVSGFSLTISLKNRRPSGSDWLSWIAKRIVRILVPFYLVAIPFLLAYLVALGAVSHIHGAFAQGLSIKLHSLLQTPPLGVALSHTLLFDPFEKQWQPYFFAPAWWFIPAILLAYALFPLILSASRTIGRIPVLVVSAAVTLVSYQLANGGILVDENWYYIVLQESFNFTLGVVIGQCWLDRRQRRFLERALFSRWSFAVALLVFIAGNVANWFPEGRLFASMLYGVSLLVMISVIAKQLEKSRFADLILRVDAYDLYLVHQPFAFPLALAARILLHGYAVFVGWFVFVGVAVSASLVLSAVQKRLFRRSVTPVALRAAG